MSAYYSIAEGVKKGSIGVPVLIIGSLLEAKAMLKIENNRSTFVKPNLILILSKTYILNMRLGLTKVLLLFSILSIALASSNEPIINTGTPIDPFLTPSAME
jgi:hypothetical protein